MKGDQVMSSLPILQVKQNNGTITPAKKEQLKFARSKIERKYNGIGHSNSHFGNLWGGYEAFRQAAFKASDDINGNVLAAKAYQSIFMDIANDYCKSASPQQILAVLKFKKKLSIFLD